MGVKNAPVPLAAKQCPEYKMLHARCTSLRLENADCVLSFQILRRQQQPQRPLHTTPPSQWGRDTVA